jgi:hypothetical protein
VLAVLVVLKHRLPVVPVERLVAPAWVVLLLVVRVGVLSPGTAWWTPRDEHRAPAGGRDKTRAWIKIIECRRRRARHSSDPVSAATVGRGGLALTLL